MSQAKDFFADFATLYEITNTYVHQKRMFRDRSVNHLNRYTDILPYTTTRIVLSGETPVEQYVNANFIRSPLRDKHVIAC